MNAITSFIVSIIMAILSIFGIGSGSGGSGGSGGGSTTPVNTSPVGYDIMADVEYGSHPQQKLDLAIPLGVGNVLSLAVHIHGGAWTGGDKSSYVTFVMPYAQDRNMITATVNYRLLTREDPSINCWTMLEDINNAITKIVDVCSSKGYAIKKALIWGESAGGHLALMYSYNYRSKSAVNIGLCYANCPPTNLYEAKYFTENILSNDEMLFMQSHLSGVNITRDNLLSEEARNAQLSVSPICYVNNTSVPTIFNSCGKDYYVPQSNGDDLEKVLKKAGVDYYYAVFPNSAHVARDSKDSAIYTVFDAKLDQMINQYVK